MRIYLDYNSTTPVHPEVREEVQPYLGENFGNPSSIHLSGRKARRAVEVARERVASFLKCSPSSIIFTSSGTEANNLAIKGIASRISKLTGKKHLITTMVEHASVYETFKFLEREGFEVTYLRPYGDGYLDEHLVENALREDTILISIMHINNETGTIYPVERIGKSLQKKGIIFHVDAVQSAGKIPLNVNKMNVHLLTISGHKLYSIKGAAALYVAKDLEIEPLLHGGHQERGLRPGTPSVPAIVGLGKACEIAMRDMEEVRAHIEKMGKILEKNLSSIEGAFINGDSPNRFPGTLNISFEGVDGETLVMALDLEGVEVSTRSACASGTPEPSRVLLSMGLGEERARSAIRISIGRFTKEEEILRACEIISKVVERLRKGKFKK